jgi:cell division protein FtsB
MRFFRRRRLDPAPSRLKQAEHAVQVSAWQLADAKAHQRRMSRLRAALVAEGEMNHFAERMEAAFREARPS